MTRSRSEPAVTRYQSSAEFFGKHNVCRIICGQIVTELPNPGQQYDVGVPRVGPETIRVLPQSDDLKRGGKKMWCVAELDEEYIRRTQDILAVYEKPRSARESWRLIRSAFRFQDFPA